MNFIEIKQSELERITLFLIDNKIILHPKISPDGTPDFTGYEGKRFIVILDRNLLVRILRLVNDGELRDNHSLQLVCSILLWSNFNNIRLNSGLALTEYSHFHRGNIESSQENNIFLEICRQYTPQHWLDLFIGRKKSIPKIILDKQETYSFFVEDDHFKMHYLEMLKLAQLFFNDDISPVEKFEKFHTWVYNNILICKYTTYFAVLLFGNKSKVFREITREFEIINKNCINQSWDLTYLSFWSTQYYYEDTAADICLFATMDKELRKLFFLTHKETLEIYTEVFGKDRGKEITTTISKIYLPRKKPVIDQDKIDKMIVEEQDNLRMILK